MTKLIRIALASSLILAPAALFAQSPDGHEKKPHTINQRKENQQDRIGQGVTNGTLSPAEAARLERQSARINREERAMRAEDHGHLTAEDRRTLTAQQNRESKRIYNTKHDLNGHK